MENNPKKPAGAHLGTKTELEEKLKAAAVTIIDLQICNKRSLPHGKEYAGTLAKSLTEIVAAGEELPEKALSVEYCDIFIGGLEALRTFGDYSFKDERLLKQAARGISSADTMIQKRWGIIKGMLEEPGKA